MTLFRVGGVPEHFNYVWHLPAFREQLAKHEIEILWQDYPGGTGAMCADLRSDSLDIALLLTEGAVADIANGNPSRIVGTWVDSPLTWGIHCRAGRHDLPSLSEARYAISRYGSGSHLMAIINCLLREMPLPTRFEVVGNLDGARAALADQTADLFMWEKFTTKFLVDRGEFDRIDHCDTPWPCFVMVARQSVIAEHSERLEQLLTALRVTLDQYPPALAKADIADRYQLLPSDVERWSQRVSWRARPELDRSALQKTISGLTAADVLSETPSERQLVAEFVDLT